ncbi:uncharacterized protein LOC108833951 [Raphanus sativus]|uniref:Uncharacterized protein LOC108833951 n=1 Tax=Raphanus sativus TaxID=3726 RepID=A0A6J0LTZ7_RAPSA|nr:uncharacterized protein LOC108833951 [Raphanus sativus]
MHNGYGEPQVYHTMFFFNHKWPLKTSLLRSYNKFQHFQNIYDTFHGGSSGEYGNAETRYADNTRRSQNRNVEAQQHKWIRPPAGYTKCNYDGAFSNTERGAKAGWIIRDDMGIFKGAANATTRYPKTALERELQALLFAMMNCWSKGHRKILFEGDNINVLKLIKGETINIDVINWIKDIRRWATKFEDVQFCWVNRKANICADILAKQVIPSSSPFRYFSYVPMFLRDALSNDYFDY